MKRVVYSLILSLLSSPAGAWEWSQPPVGCIEDFVPQKLIPPCPDLTQVLDPNVDLPIQWTPEELKFWNVEHRSNLALCRSLETDHRYSLGLQKFSEAVLQVTWMRIDANKDQEEKVLAIYEAANQVGMPSQILFGSLKQESLLSNLGLTPDGNNYSCGLGQINIQEWCRYVSSLSEVDQILMGWPVGAKCAPESLPTSLLAPFYELGKQDLGALPDYFLTPKNFQKILPEDVYPTFPPGTLKEQRIRYDAAMSFLIHCQNFRSGIFAKAFELRHLFDEFVPRSMQKANRYYGEESFQRNCGALTATSSYPLHTGWLLAVAIYNAGPKQTSLVSHYFRMTRNLKENSSIWKKLTPLDLIEALHWGGRFEASDRLLHFKSIRGKKLTQSWFKSCIVQRHIARVIQYATLPGIEIARSLDTEGCSPNRVPDYRQVSSGKK